MSDQQNKGEEHPPSDETAKALQDDIEKIRGKLGGMVSELDHRRHDLFDLKKQLRRHAVPLALAGFVLLGVAAGSAALAARRRRQRAALGARLGRLRGALARMIDQPERVATPAPSIPWKLVAAGAAAIVSVVAKRLTESAVREAPAGDRGAR